MRGSSRRFGAASSLTDTQVLFEYLAVHYGVVGRQG